LKRKTPLRRKTKPKLTKIERSLMGLFLGDARRRQCASCGLAAPAVKLHAHHVLRRQVIERILRDRGYSEWEVFAVAWDPRWRMPLCTTCHGDHHSGMRRLGIAVVTAKAPNALLVAEIHDLLYALEREHTEEEEHAR
jgi:hypothetical protein